MTLKYEKTAEIGDMIKAYDFQPYAGRAPSFIEGKVVNKGYDLSVPYAAYEVVVTRDVFGGEEEQARIGETFYVPFESTMDYDGRVEVIVKPSPMVVTRKIGRNKGRPRLWLEGKILTAAGFGPGDRYNFVEGWIIKNNEEGSRKISGKGDKPIVDILGRALEELFDEIPETVTVTVAGPGLILIR